MLARTMLRFRVGMSVRVRHLDDCSVLMHHPDPTILGLGLGLGSGGGTSSSPTPYTHDRLTLGCGRWVVRVMGTWVGVVGQGRGKARAGFA